MFAELVERLSGGEFVGPFADVMGVHVRPVCGSFTKFSGEFFDDCCGDNECGVLIECDCGGAGGGNKDGNFPPRCGGGGNSGVERCVGGDVDVRFRILCDAEFDTL